MRRFFCLLSLSILAGCGTESPVSWPATSAGAQSHPLQSTGERVGWTLVSNEPEMLSIGLVASPGFTIESARVCVSTEPFLWVDPATCAIGWQPAAASHQTRILVPLADIAPLDEICSKPLWLQVWAPVITADGKVSSYAGAFKARIAYGLACDPAPVREGCVREAAEWSKLSSLMPIDGLVLGGARYSRTDLVALLESIDGSDASIALGRELATAKLNAPASRPDWVNEAIEAGDGWLLANGEKLPFGLKSTEDGAANPFAWDTGMNLATLLERFNAATFGNERCE